jgi:ribosomal subunit interface protein
VQISINGKQIDIGDALRDHIERETTVSVNKYFENHTDAKVSISKDGPDFRSDISVHVGKGIIIQGHAVAGDARSAFDSATENVSKRLRRYKRRLRDHHKKRSDKFESATAQQYVLAAEPDQTTENETAEPDQPIVIAEMETAIEELTVGEAVMRMDLASQPALLFRSSAHGGLNLVYYREDGNIGWVDPKNA